MHALHIAAECAPFAKVGGMADVVGALPAALAEHGIQSSVLMPFYGGPDGKLARRAGETESVHTGVVFHHGEWFPFEVFRSGVIDGVDLFLLHEPEHFGDDGVYFRESDGAWFERGDVRFLLFQLAALDWLRSENTPITSETLLHLHDHHTGLIPVLLRYDDANADIASSPTVFTVHSADHHGEFDWATWDRVFVEVPDWQALDHGGRVNSLKAGVGHSDAVTTVSPSYARELLAGPEPSHGLDYVFELANNRLTGILNGVDYGVWHPSVDPLLPATYSADDLSGKAETKRDLCAEMDLNPERPLLVFIGRLTPEKGGAILAPGVDQILRQSDASIGLLGTGYAEFEDAVRDVHRQLEADGLAGRLGVRLAFDNALAHRMYAAGDALLMPSLSEPCGLNQMYAMAYGTPPVVHAVGGLRDTVTEWDGVDGTGFRFDAFTPEAFADAALRALTVFDSPTDWSHLVQNAMAADFSWGQSAQQFAQIYDHIIPD
ncbi:MAG: glycogen synthase GlgA [Rubricoccaceae bacterium]